MAKKYCPNCGVQIKSNAFFLAVSKGAGVFKCNKCDHVLKSDVSLYTGLYFFVLIIVFLPILAFFGFSKSPLGTAGQRIQQVFNVGPEASLLIGLSIIGAMVLLIYLGGYIVFNKVNFNNKT